MIALARLALAAGPIVAAIVGWIFILAAVWFLFSVIAGGDIGNIRIGRAMWAP